MAKLYLFYSKFNKYFDFLDVYNQNDIYFYCIEDIIGSSNLFFNKDDVAFLLFNDNYFIDLFIKKYKGTIRILNQEFHKKKLLKKDIQLKISSISLDTPKIYNDKVIFPCLLKENTHQKENILIKSKNELLKVIEKFDITSYYLEEIINYEKEIKLYYVFGKVFTKDGLDLSIENNEICKIIANELKIEIMSIDILIKGNKKYIIDVNTSPSFYKTENGRAEFINMIFKEENNN